MNPFTLSYHPKYFCDRCSETEQLKENVVNGRNTLLHSPRRLGKSALIHHLFCKLEDDGQFETIFIDLFATRNMEGMIRTFAEKMLEKYHKRNLVEGIKRLLKGLNATLTFSSDGTPQLGLAIYENQYGTSLQQLFDYLEKRKKRVIIAFDEFQEIGSYPEKAEATLRTYIQQLKNVNFIFSGSSNHLLQEMFFSAKRPFYQSTEVMVLGKIYRNNYVEFISSQFKQFGKEIDNEAVDWLLDFAETYTYYTQVICNHAFYKTETILDVQMAKSLTKSYINNRKLDYQSLFYLLPENQKKIAIAVAQEGIVPSPTAIDFIIKHKLPSVSSTLQAIKALTEKEIVYKNMKGYSIYDVFFRRFLEMYYL